jgi:integrase
MTSKNPGIYKRGNTWTAHVHWTDIQGVRRQKKFGGFPTKAAAVAYQQTFLAEIRSGRRRATTRLTLGEFLTREWLPNRRNELKASTAATYDNIVTSYLLPHLGAVKLEELTVRRIESFFKELQASGARGRSKKEGAGLSAKTVSNIANVLNRAYKDAIRWELVATNPVQASIKPTKRTREMRFWEPAKLAQFLEETSDVRYAGIWHLAAMTGLRRGEILGLRWEHVDLVNRTISVQETRVRAGRQTIVETPKSKRSRRVFSIDQRTARALERWKAIQSKERLLIGEYWLDQDGYVVTEPDGRLPDPNTFTRQFEALCKRLGFPKIRLHDLRHTYVSAARHSGVDLKTISERVGHADINVTLAVYDHVFHEDDAVAAATTADFIYGQKKRK